MTTTSKNFSVAFATGILFCLMFVGVGFTGAQEAPPKPKPKPKVAATPPPLEEDEVINIDTEVVNVLFSAQDKQRRLLTNLKKDNIRITENGKPQEIVAFTRKVDLPMSLTILIDTSASQARTLPQEKDAAQQFVEAVIRPSMDEVAVLTFTGETVLEQGLTGSVSRVRRAIDRIRYIPGSAIVSGGAVGTPPISGRNRAIAASTAIWDALWVTSNEVLGASPSGTRRAIILLSDGVDTFSQTKLRQAVDEAIKAEAVIYSIGIGDDMYGGVNKGNLKRISQLTGGRAFFPRNDSELRAAFRQIEEEMRSQYLLVYEPLNQERDGSYRKIDIEIIDPAISKNKIKITHREGYFAKDKKTNK